MRCSTRRGYRWDELEGAETSGLVFCEAAAIVTSEALSAVKLRVPIPSFASGQPPDKMGNVERRRTVGEQSEANTALRTRSFSPY